MADVAAAGEGCGGRVVNSGGTEVAGALGDGWNRRDSCGADELLDALVVAEEEEAVFEEGEPDRPAVDVATVFGLATGWGEVVAGVQVFVAEVFEQRAVEAVGAVARADIDDAAIEAAKLGGDVVGLHGELVDAVEDGKEGDLAGLGLERGDAVEEVLIGTRAAAVDAREQRAGRQLHTGRELGELDEIARVQRDGFDVVLRDGGLYVGGLRLQDGQIAVDGDQLVRAADGQREIDGNGLADVERNSHAPVRIEAVGARFDLVAARREIREIVVAVGAGGGVVVGATTHLGEAHLRGGDGSSGAVGDAPFELAGYLGMERGAKGREDEQKDEQGVTTHEAPGWARVNSAPGVEERF